VGGREVYQGNKGGGRAGKFLPRLLSTSGPRGKRRSRCGGGNRLFAVAAREKEDRRLRWWPERKKEKGRAAFRRERGGKEERHDGGDQAKRRKLEISERDAPFFELLGAREKSAEVPRCFPQKGTEAAVRGHGD